MKTLGIAAHSFEGGALCFLTACREGAVHLGPHMHPRIVLSAVPLGLSMPGWENDDHAAVAEFLTEGVRRVADAGADFYICPANTAHIVLEQIAEDLPIPGLHIADVVCHEIIAHGWGRVGLLGTSWTMTGPVYANALAKRGLEQLIPDQPMRERLNAAIFHDLCQGIFAPETTALFVRAIADLQAEGADCVILGCTEIPLIITDANSPLPTLDSTRLLATYAVREAVSERPIDRGNGWLAVGHAPSRGSRLYSSASPGTA
jgi:aspartate racemase